VNDGRVFSEYFVSISALILTVLYTAIHCYRHFAKRPLGRHSYSWEDNIKMYLQEVVWGSVNWTDLAQDRKSLVGACEYNI
jgi:endo-1,4-beta-mannosidase